MAHLYIYQRFTYIRLYILKTVFSITHSQTRYAGARGQELGQRFQPGRLRRRACAVSSNLRCSQRSVVGSVVGCKVPGINAVAWSGSAGDPHLRWQHLLVLTLSAPSLAAMASTRKMALERMTLKVHMYNYRIYVVRQCKTPVEKQSSSHLWDLRAGPHHCWKGHS